MLSRKPNKSQVVLDALKALCAEGLQPGETLFVPWYSAKRVAERAGCSESSARKWLDSIAWHGWCRSRAVHGVKAYRYDAA